MRLTTTMRQTARELVQAFVAGQDDTPKSEVAARKIGVHDSLLRAWLTREDKSLRPFAAFRIALFFNLPLEAVYAKDEPIGPIVARLRKIVCPPNHRRAA
jgi:hypothetical protein